MPRPSASRAFPHAVLIPVEGGKHLWVGESQTRRVLTEIVAAVNPDALPLPDEWHGTGAAQPAERALSARSAAGSRPAGR